jgi:heavy metal sensor kinase
MSRLPIRLRLAGAFAVVMALVLVATGLFVYERTASDLERQLDRELAARLAGVVAIVRDDGDDLGDPRQDPLARVDPEGVVQVLGPNGDVAGATAEQLARKPLLDSETVARMVSGELRSADVEAPVLGEPLRLVGRQTEDDGVEYTVLVGASLEERDQALSSLSRLLLLGGPIALLLASLAGYGVASGALRPVEAMRRRAAEISDRDPGQRLPVPSSRDEIASLGTTLNAMLARLESALERERRFVADASHELRTPLATLKAEIDLALSRGRTPRELEEALRSAGDETNRLVQLAEDLLVIARADEGGLPLQSEEVDLSELIERVCTRYLARPEAAGRIDLDGAGGLTVHADRIRLEQALSNLIDNALRYGGGRVGVRAEQVGEQVEIHVTDAGDGFPEPLLNTAFERFSRADQVRSRGGAGLGLAIVDAIATAHGGSAHVRNRPGTGADAWLSIPLNGRG